MHALPFHSLRRLALRLTLTVAPLLAGCGQSPAAERVPFTPTTDSAVLEHVPATATDAKARERAALRRALAARADQLDLALRLARLDIEEGRASGDPRYLGRAQAALEPWWSAEQPPPGVRLLRATILQGRHEFPAALADLDALVRETPDDAHFLNGKLDTTLKSCDPAGFPNGRRPGDDVVDIELRVAMGYLFENDTQAPSRNTPFHDAVLQDASQFDAVFPYLKAPNAGAGDGT
ncbi:DUF4331 family protein [Corallococcus exercitus]|uniref:DUF4331 family protein n=1 Tax=Corallococcus exercitus TaxID=2316736 RepID=UPI001FD37A11|nr:DUF4331 family protein [Corallococcus exercitus]